MTALIAISEARERVLLAISPLSSENVPISEASGRFLAADVLAASDVPPFPSSAMDGYAVEPGEAGRQLVVSGESRAGSPSPRPLAPGEAIRISTGARVPDGAGAVVRQEDTEQAGETLFVRTEVRAGDNVRPAGDVLRADQVVLSRGMKLGAAELAAAVSAGSGALAVARRPCLAIVSTGDELRDPGEPLGEGQIHDSNAPMLRALATGAGARVVATERLADDRAATEAGLARALEHADLLTVAGGVSVGPHDHVKPALAALGVEEMLFGVSLQPGKPTWVGARGDKLVFGLPGNPVSAAVTFTLFVAPALAALQGAAQPLPRRAEAILGAEVRRNHTREQVLRVRLEREGGQLLATPNGRQPSHNIMSLVGADALAFIPPGEGVLEAGSPVAVESLRR